MSLIDSQRGAELRRVVSAFRVDPLVSNFYGGTMDYWEECIAIAADECGLSLTKEQLECLAGAVEGGHENYGMAFGYDCIPNPLQLENDKLKRDLKKERDKVHCEVCNGRGRIITQGPYHYSDSECWKCRGEGRNSL